MRVVIMDDYKEISRRAAQVILDVIKQITQAISTPVIAEGGFWLPDQVCIALRSGAIAVVI